MASNVGRWFKYAKAKLDATLGSANRELDAREAKLAAEADGKPWLASEGDAPTLDEVRSRIEADAARARPADPEADDGDAAPKADRPAGGPAASEGGTGTAPGGERTNPAAGRPGAGDDLQSVADAAELSQAKLELEERARQSAERLDQIRRELGVEPPAKPA